MKERRPVSDIDFFPGPPFPPSLPVRTIRALKGTEMTDFVHVPNARMFSLLES